MAEGSVGLAPDSTGKKVRTQELVVGANTVEQEVVSLADQAGNLLTSQVGDGLGRSALDVNLLSTTSGIASTTGSIAGATSVQAAVAAAGNVTFSIAGTYAGTFVFEASTDGGTTWFAWACARADGSGTETGFTTPNVVRAWEACAPGITHFRVRCSAYTSGTATVRINPGPFLYDPAPIAQVAPLTSKVSTVFFQAAAGTGAAVNTEVQQSLAAVRLPAGGVVAAGNSVDCTPTPGKTFRILAIELFPETATANTLTLFLRAAVGAAPTTASQLIWFALYMQPAAPGVPPAWRYPEGIDIPSGTHFTFSAKSTVASISLGIQIIGYEF